MCVLLVANSSVRTWLESAADRQSNYFPDATAKLLGEDKDGQTRRFCSPALLVGKEEPENEAINQHAAHRSVWIQAHFRYRLGCREIFEFPGNEERGVAFALASEWQKALEAFTKTWRRILAFVGLRR